MTRYASLTPTKGLSSPGRVRAFVATLAVMLLVPQVSLALEPYFLDTLMVSFRSRGSCLSVEDLAHPGAALFTVNGLALPTYRVPGEFVPYPNGDQANLFRAEFSSSLLRPGSNDIEYRSSS